MSQSGNIRFKALPKNTLKKKKSPTRYPFTRVIVSIFLCVLGVAFLLFPGIYKKLSAAPSVQKNPIRIASSLLASTPRQESPVRIIIPSLSIDLPVVDAPVVDGYWQTSDTSASHGDGSAVPGEKGNDVIFAHAREGLFLPLRSITKGAVIYVMTKDKWYHYRVVSTQLVDPSQVAVIAPTVTATLTLYTCSGYFDEKRFIATAKPL